MGRKTHTWESINNATEVLLAKNNYNEVGQLWKKELHNGLQTTTYTYNERGWLSGSGSPKFDLKLRYNSPTKGALPQYNGNISEQEYTGDYSGNRWFTYQYDALNRLTTSVYNNSNLLGEQLVYDKMGNITSLTRGNYGTLGYVYDGNRLSSVSGFKAGSYGYDVNGNATTDGTRGVTITYNELNLPSQVSGAGTATYTYDAAGNKLRSVQGGTTRDYIAGIQYTNGLIDFIQTEEGRAVRKSDGSYAYEYSLKDHLGNTRVVIDNNGNNTQRVVQEDEYYAFGLNVGRYTLGNKNNYLYNGKEKQDVLTDEYDYGARFYDPVIGRWTTIDPSTEKGNQETLSPYHYGLNNPVRYDDPDGRCPTCPRAGLGSNPLYVMAEGFRQYMQAAGALIDKAYVSVSETVSTVVATAKTSIGIGSATTTTSVDVTNTTTASTNLSGFLNTHGKNTPSEPIFKVQNTTTVSAVKKVEVSETINGIDMKATNKSSTNLVNGQTTNSKEVVAGKGSNGAFVSQTTTSSSSTIQTGLKASYTTPAAANTTTNFTLRVGYTVKKEEKQ